MRRREFIAGLAGGAACSVVARAQQGDRVRRIGVLMSYDENDPEVKDRVSAFTQALARLGWTVGGNVQMDLRGAGGDANRMRALAQELVGLHPDVIATNGTAATAAAQGETRTRLTADPRQAVAAIDRRPRHLGDGCSLPPPR